MSYSSVVGNKEADGGNGHGAVHEHGNAGGQDQADDHDKEEGHDRRAKGRDSRGQHGRGNGNTPRSINSHSSEPKDANGGRGPTNGSDRTRARSPTQQPKNYSANEQLYILTLLTDSALHSSMNELRKKYFPKELNHLDAHITLFHALPESHLEDQIIPSLEIIAGKTSKFKIGATTPFKLKKGIAVGMPKDHGGNASRKVHTHLVKQWSGFLSQQDFGFQAHYTIMNKVDDERKINAAFQEVRDGWKASFGTAEGLTLWRYHPRGWDRIRDLPFQNR